MSIAVTLGSPAVQAVTRSAQAAAVHSPRVHSRISDTQRTTASERDRAIGNGLCSKACNKK